MRNAGSRLRAVPIAREEWCALAADFDDLSYRQFPAFVVEASRANGAAPEFVALRAGAEFAGLCALRIKKLPGLPIGLAYALHGPLCMRNGIYSWDLYSDCLRALSDLYVAKRGLVLRVAPPYAVSQDSGAAVDAFTRAGFGLTAESPKRTIMLALDRDLAQIRRGLNGKWRNMLVQSERLAIAIAETEDPGGFALMAPMLKELENPKRFRSAQDLAFFERMQRAA